MSRPTWETTHERKECEACDGEGVVRCALCLAMDDGLWCGFSHTCKGCSGNGWVPVSDTEREALGQERLEL